MTNNTNTPPTPDISASAPAAASSPQEAVRLEDLERQVVELSDSVQKQSISQAQFQSSMLTIQQQLSTLKASVDSEKQRQKSTLEQMSRILSLLKTTVMPKYKSVEDVPGIRIPRWFDVVLDFSTSFQNPYVDGSGLQPGSSYLPTAIQSISIGPDGPFIVTQITPLLQITAGLDVNRIEAGSSRAEVGRILPATSYQQLANNLGKTNTVGTGYNTPSLAELTWNDGFSLAAPVNWGILADMSEFDISIKVLGNGRLWTNTPISTADLFGTKGYPTFTGTQGIFERSDRIQVTASIKNDLLIGTYDGNRKLRICFHGYQILNPITLCDVLGY